MPFDAPHAVSPGLWTLAWKRLRSDTVAMVSLAIVAVFLLMMVLSATGLIARDWAKEVGVNYAPPTFIGPEPVSATPETAPSTAADKPTELPVEDPLADALAAIGHQGAAKAPEGEAKAPEGAEESKTVDPLAEVMADIRSKAVQGAAAEARAPTRSRWSRSRSSRSSFS